MRTEPAPSEPWCSGAMPAAAHAAAPVLEPPAFMPRFHGLWVMPVTGQSPLPFQPSSETVVLPIMMPPAPFRRSTCR
jgi:hypothetical protein